MAPAQRDRIAVSLRATAPLLFLLAAAAVLLRFPPQGYSFYPRCPIFTLFHIQCPGCGSTRALAALLRGHLSEALHLNSLFTLALPFAFFWIARSFVAHKPFRWVQPPRQAVYAALAIAVAFTIARNL